MTKIELPPYRIIIPNEIYGKSAKPRDFSIGRKIPTTQIVKLARFKIPTQEEVINHIRKAAGKIKSYSLKEDKFSEEDSVTSILKDIPFSEIEKISKGNEKSLNHLREHYLKSDLQDGRDYLWAFNALVPTNILDLAKKSAIEEKEKFYEELIQKTAFSQWDLGIRLSDDGKFPDSLELEYLMDRGVRDSDVFSVSGTFESYQVVSNQIRLLNNLLGSKGLIPEIEDSSYQILEQRATSTIGTTAKCIMRTQAVGGLVTKIKQALEEMDEQEPSPRNPYGYEGDCSLN